VLDPFSKGKWYGIPLGPGWESAPSRSSSAVTPRARPQAPGHPYTQNDMHAHRRFHRCVWMSAHTYPRRGWATSDSMLWNHFKFPLEKLIHRVNVRKREINRTDPHSYFHRIRAHRLPPSRGPGQMSAFSELLPSGARYRRLPCSAPPLQHTAFTSWLRPKSANLEAPPHGRPRESKASPTLLKKDNQFGNKKYSDILTD